MTAKPDDQEAYEHGNEEIDVTTCTLATELHAYLVDVDSGYRNAKIAKQYKWKVQSVAHTCKMKLTKRNAEQLTCQKLPAFCFLLIPGKEGVKFLKFWLFYAVAKYQPGTVRSYLMSLCLFLQVFQSRGQVHSKCNPRFT